MKTSQRKSQSTKQMKPVGIAMNSIIRKSSNLETR